jgi:hypothetical protein
MPACVQMPRAAECITIIKVPNQRLCHSMYQLVGPGGFHSFSGITSSARLAGVHCTMDSQKLHVTSIVIVILYPPSSGLASDHTLGAQPCPTWPLPPAAITISHLRRISGHFPHPSSPVRPSRPMMRLPMTVQVLNV